MKIAMMTRWNVPAGQSSHAEPIGRAWRKMGHDVKVLAPAGMDLDVLCQKDEPFVQRCYMQDIWGERERKDYFFDPKPFLEEDYDIFLVEMAAIMPMPELLEIFPRIKRKANTVHVVHEIGLPEGPNWRKFDWDAIVCFDKRYQDFMAGVFPKDKFEIIPFPCHPPQHGDRKEARLKLGLPLDKKIVFAYGFNMLYNHLEIFPLMENLARDYPASLLLVTHDDWVKLEPQPEFLILRNETPDMDRLYTYLHACDAYIYHGRKAEGVGVSSSAATCFGAGRPVLGPSFCNFLDPAGKEVIKYSSLQDMEQKLRDVFGGAAYVKESLQAAEEYATKNSDDAIAGRFIELFERLKRR